MGEETIGVEAETLTPFAYHSVPIHAGSATLPTVIGDRAMAFALAGTLGMLSQSLAMPKMSYREHIGAMPWRSSVFETDAPELLAPLARRLNIDAERTYNNTVRQGTRSGNLKTFFLTQEVPPGVRYRGAIYGTDPFKLAGESELVVRIGLHRNGMVRLRPCAEVAQVRVNVATAGLFGARDRLEVERFLLHGLQLSKPLALAEAAEEMAQWA